MSRQTPPHQHFVHHVALAAALALSAVACAKNVPTNAQPCPCAAGYVCCQSGVCAQGQDACDEATSALSAHAVGSWTGYIENYTGLSSGADTLTLSFSLADDGTLQGTAKLGDAAPPAPATDPNVAWPPGITADSAIRLFSDPHPIEGFSYPAHAIKWESRRLKFEISLGDPWAPWCELQTPLDVGTGDHDGGTASPTHWSCGPTGWSGISGTTTCQANDSSLTAPCAKFALCSGSGPCTCSSTGCTADAKVVASFDIALEGNSGNGSFALQDGSNNVRLTRASH
jgi:hypothetical protein